MQLAQHEHSHGEDRSSVTSVRRETGLARIALPEINVCVWRRALPTRLGRWLDSVSRTLVHDVAADVSPNDRSAEALFSGLPDRSEAHAWAADVAKLIAAFCALRRTTSLRASLATVDSDKCRKFHADYKPIRLVCTYAGPGTEWVDDRHAVRSALCHDDACIDTANTRIVPSGASIQRASAGDVVLLKGERFAGNAGRGAVHRSPPIERTGERRIVLTLDER